MPALFLLFIPIFWFLIIRPQQQQRRAHQAVVAGLAVGQRVMTVGGLMGTVAALDHDTVTLDCGNDVELTFGRTFVRQQVAAPAADDTPDATDATDVTDVTDATNATDTSDDPHPHTDDDREAPADGPPAGAAR